MGHKPDTAINKYKKVEEFELMSLTVIAGTMGPQSSTMTIPICDTAA